MQPAVAGSVGIVGERALLDDAAPGRHDQEAVGAKSFTQIIAAIFSPSARRRKLETDFPLEARVPSGTS